MPDNFLVHHFLEKSAERFPDKIAFIHENVRASYKEVNELSNRLADFLLASCANRGDRVVILSENRLEYVAGYYGSLKAGCIVSPLNTDLKPDGLCKILRELAPFIVIASTRFEDILQKSDLKSSGVNKVLLVSPKKKWDDFGIAMYNWHDINSLTDNNANPGLLLDENTAASIIFTSGTTAKSKGVLLSHKNIVTNTVSICKTLKLTEDDIQMVVLPFFYVMGKSLLNTHFAVGGKVIINNKFAFSATVIKQMADEKVTGFSGVPSTFTHLLHRSPLLNYRSKLDSLRFCAQAGGHMANNTKIELKDSLPHHTDIYIMYGASEASARLTILEPEKFHEKLGSIGRVIDGVRLKVLDKEGKQMGPGCVGELVAEGPNIMQGYWNDIDGTKAVLDNHGYHTGDLGFMDDDGYFFLVGRKDDLIKSGGHRINPMEIENALLETGLVIEVIVIGISDKLLANRLVALAVPVTDTSKKEELLIKCSKVLPKYKTPSSILFIKSLPKLPNGKVDRAESTRILNMQEKVNNHV